LATRLARRVPTGFGKHTRHGRAGHENDDDAADSSTGLAVSKEEPLALTSGISGAPLPKGGSFLNHGPFSVVAWAYQDK
jgi:hypothetical protein